jgi:hypothetical protein
VTGASIPGRSPVGRTPASLRRVVAWGAILGSLVVGGACRVQAETVVDVAPDGSGVVTVTVTLDREAAAALGDPAQLDVADLAPGGWEVVDPAPGPDGGLVVGARRRFDSPEEVPVLLEQLAGPDGPVQEASLQVDSSQLATDYRWRSVLRSSGDPAVLSDPELTALLDGLPLGRTAEELASIGADRSEAATATLVVRLPGGTEQSGSVPLTGEVPASVEVVAESTVVSATRVLGLVVVVVLLGSAVAAALRSRR